MLAGKITLKQEKTKQFWVKLSKRKWYSCLKVNNISEKNLLLTQYVFYIRSTFYIQNIKLSKLSKVYYVISLYLAVDFFQTYFEQMYLYLYIYNCFIIL